MENLEILKLELLSQKTEIENKGGVVNVANSNPSPGEITAGIKTISVPDFTSANATVEDVVSGKTFYAGNTTIKVGTKVVPDLTIATALEDDVLEGKTFYAGNQELKVGTFVDNSEIYQKLFLSNNEINEQIYFTIPEGYKILKTHVLYCCDKKNMEITFNQEFEEVGDYAFYNCKLATFPNFGSLTHLNKIGQYAFCYLDVKPFNFTSMPICITELGIRCFNNSIYPNANIVLHSALKSIGSYCFASSNKVEVNTLTIADDIG